MVEITLVEVHLEDAQFEANAEAIANAPLSALRGLLGGDDDATEEAAGAESRADDLEDAGADADASSDRPGPSLGKLLFGVVALAVVAVVARRLLGGDAGDVDEAVDEAVEIAEIDVGE